MAGYPVGNQGPADDSADDGMTFFKTRIGKGDGRCKNARLMLKNAGVVSQTLFTKTGAIPFTF